MKLKTKRVFGYDVWFLVIITKLWQKCFINKQKFERNSMFRMLAIDESGC